MQYRPTTNELYLDIQRSGDEEMIALARSYADAEFKKDRKKVPGHAPLIGYGQDDRRGVTPPEKK
jgi:hypothetical protein